MFFDMLSLCTLFYNYKKVKNKSEFTIYKSYKHKQSIYFNEFKK